MKTIDLNRNTILVINGTVAHLQTHGGCMGTTIINKPSLEEIVEVGARGLGWKAKFPRDGRFSRVSFTEKTILAVRGLKTCAADTGLDGARLVTMLARVANAKIGV